MSSLWEHSLPNPPYEYGTIVPPIGPDNAKMMLVGEGPGEDEVLNLTPFSGAAGWELDKILDLARIVRPACRITNVSLERPIDNKFQQYFYNQLSKPKRLVPKQRLLDWHHCLNEQVKECNPNVIVAMGNEPLFALVGHKKITKRRGSIYRSLTGHKVVATVHPAHFMRSWRWRQLFLHDLIRAKSESKFPHIVEPNHTFIIAPKFQQAYDFLVRILDEKQPVVIDLETRSEHIACIGIADRPDHAITIPFMRVTGHYWQHANEVILLKLIMRVLMELPIIGQNLMAFDCAYFLNEWGVKIKNLDMDTMHAHHVAYIEGPTSHGLDYFTSIYTNPVMPYYKDEGKVWEKSYGEKQFWEYCCKDCVATYQTRNGINEELSELGLSSFYNGYVKPLSWVLQDLQFTGIKVDEDRKLAMGEENRKQISRLQNIIDVSVDRATGGHTTKLNVKSNPQMKEFLYGWLKLPFQHTGIGTNRRVTTDEDALVSLKKEAKGRTDFFDIVLNIRMLRKENEFLATPVYNGRMNTSLVVSGTETGRLASRSDAFDRGTNLQNVKHRLRAIFIPDPGFELWEVDGSQAEARVVAILAQQWDLVELFERGDIDVHWENAKRIFGLHGGLIHDHTNSEHYRMRYLAKRIIHASNYGMSWYKFRQLLLAEAGIDMPKPEVEALLATYHQLYPNIEGVFHGGVIKQLRQNRTLTTPYGRVRVFHDRWPKTGIGELFRKAYAYIPQSTIGDLINRALLDFDDWAVETLGRVQVLTQVHDSILYQVKPAMAVAAKAKIKELMERPIDFDYHKLTVPADFKRGMNWGDYDDKENPQGMREAA